MTRPIKTERTTVFEKFEVSFSTQNGTTAATIQILDVNDNIPRFQLPSYQFFVMEEIENVFVGQVKVFIVWAKQVILPLFKIEYANVVGKALELKTTAVFKPTVEVYMQLDAESCNIGICEMHPL